MHPFFSPNPSTIRYRRIKHMKHCTSKYIRMCIHRYSIYSIIEQRTNNIVTPMDILNSNDPLIRFSQMAHEVTKRSQKHFDKRGPKKKEEIGLDTHTFTAHCISSKEGDTRATDFVLFASEMRIFFLLWIESFFISFS